MRVSVIGAGAIGGWLTAGFLKAGAEARVLARGASLEALRSGGLCLDDGTEQHCYPVHATTDPSDLKGADILLLGLKAHDLPAMAPAIQAALGPETIVVPAINGLPWWFFENFGGPAKGQRIEAVDPDGVLSRALPAERVVGCVVHAASHVTAPAHIRLVKADRVWLGDAAGSGQYAQKVAEALRAGDVPAEVSDHIHREVWNKLWGNSCMNPLTALSRAGMSDFLADDGARGLAISMMREMSALGDQIGLEGFDDPEGRIAVTRKLGAFRTSMLQDVEAGRPIELDPILGGLVELGRHLGQATPVMEGVYGLARMLDTNLRAEKG